MSELDRSQFREFFHALYGPDRDPFPWQTMLLERVLDSGWPDLLDLPTASGKTTCIDIGIFALAIQANSDHKTRKSPRRMFFVVDRRIVVDEAFERAQRLSAALRYSVLSGKERPRFLNDNEKLFAKIHKRDAPVLHQVAERLCVLSNTGVPLAVTRLRGGVATDDAWAQLPTQPAIVTSTVDQIGSRMLFRSYGCSPLAAPVHAALVAYDSLIVLDEAHCSVPFQQTASAVRDYLDTEKWSEHKEVIASPMRLMIMTATPPASLHTERRFPASNAERAEALNDKVLIQRCSASKMATLELVAGKATESNDPLVGKAATAAANFVTKFKRKRVAVMVNRVRTAQAMFGILKEDFAAGNERRADIILLTGQMRPIDRDDLIRKWSDSLKSGSDKQLDRPVILVTTQCLEVGADFSFDALVTECASLDALLQRFGRVDRLGTLGDARAIILTRSDDIKEANDRIYGPALAETWNWLGNDKAEVNFGIDAMVERRRTLEPEALKKLLAPAPDAPVLMPAHVDLLCQTSPRPEPDLDIGAYLHGTGRGAADVRVAFRADLPVGEPPTSAEEEEAWLDTIRLCPPATAECLPVSLWKLRRYLGSGKIQRTDDDEDVEGLDESDDSEQGIAEKALTPFIVWRGHNSIVSWQPSQIRPGDTIVLPTAPKGTIPYELGMAGDGAAIDRADEAHYVSQRRYVLRVHPDVLPSHPAIQALFKLIEDADGMPLIDELRIALTEIANSEPSEMDGGKTEVASWLRALCAFLAKNVLARNVAKHPLKENSLIIAVRPPRASSGLVYQWDEDDSDDSDEISLKAHSDRVGELAGSFARAALPAFADLLAQAGRFHDIGKLDERFQQLLYSGLTPIKSEPRAKSEFRLPPARERELRNTLGLPTSFRHEMASLQLLQNTAGIDLSDSSDLPSRDLLLHLVAAHHGHARPFAPVSVDDSPPLIDAMVASTRWIITTHERQVFIPHRLASGVADRFWRLTRRFGWWGLAYLEAQLRLADWHASQNPTPPGEEAKS